MSIVKIPVSKNPSIKKYLKHKHLEDPLMFFDSFPYWDKQEVPSLYFNLASFNMKPNVDSVKVGVRAYTYLEQKKSTNKRTKIKMVKRKGK